MTTNSLIKYNLTLKIKSNSDHGWHKSDQLHQLLSYADGSLEDSPLVYRAETLVHRMVW